MTSISGGRSSRRCCRTWRRCSPKPIWAWRPATPSWSRTNRLRRRVFDKIAAEHQRSINAHKLITGQDDLLADNPALARSVFNRFPYLEPLNHLQVELLRRYRSGDDDELVQRGILLTMNGLASALRNSG